MKKKFARLSMINEIYTCVTSTSVWARSDDAAFKGTAFDTTADNHE